MGRLARSVGWRGESTIARDREVLANKGAVVGRDAPVHAHVIEGEKAVAG